MTMNLTTERRRRRRRTTPIVFLVLLNLLFNFAISAAAAAVHLLDLSYLFRTKASSLAAAIRQGYDEIPAAVREAEETAVLDLDLTSSLLEQKNYTQVMEAALSSTSKSISTTSSHVLKLTARRNQWTSQDGTAILQQILNKLSENDDLVDEKQADVEHGIGETAITTTITTTEATDGSSSADINSKDSTNQMAVNDDDDGNVTATTPAEVDATTTTSMEEGATEESIPVTTTSTSTTLSAPPPTKKPAFVLQSLDLGWNYLGGGSSSKSLKSFHKALQKLVSHPRCPTTLNLELCGLSPAACRSIAKGIVERYPSSSSSISVTNGDDQDEKTESAAAVAAVVALPPPPLSLNLACNEAIGDGGVAALAAAIRTVAASQKHRNRKSKNIGEKEQSSSVEEEEATVDEDDHDVTVLERLDLSSCSISDAGAEALAVALEKHPLCVKHLDLSNNDITNEGASTLARALLERIANNRCGKILTLNLSNNKGIGDRGAKELAEAVQEGCIENMILRSCHLHADGVAYFGKAMRILAERGGDDKTRKRHFSIDLSGNPLGILRKKAKSGNKYSASALKSKATETTSAYMNLIGKTVQKGLKDLGLAEGGGNGLDTLESDDEEEERMGKTDEENDDSKNKCGGISLAESFIADDDQEDPKNSEKADDAALHIQMGLRHCSLDTRASEALAAVLQESRKQRLSMNLTFDMRMNDVLEEEIVAALHGEDGYDDKVTEMAESYLDAVEVIREAQQRALEAARIARTRAKMEAEREEAWGTPVGVHATGDDWDDDYEREWDSDAEYDPPGDDEDDYWS